MQSSRPIRAPFAHRAQIRLFHNSRNYKSSWSPGPAPPRLPKEEQEMFEKLQKQSTGAFSTPTATPSTTPSLSDLRARINQSPDSSPSSTPSSEVDARVKATGEGEELHPHVRRGARPEFDGDTNPKTGEVGGPKNEPLRWGVASDWSYNGRVTDF